MQTGAIESKGKVGRVYQGGALRDQNVAPKPRWRVVCELCGSLGTASSAGGADVMVEDHAKECACQNVMVEEI